MVERTLNKIAFLILFNLFKIGSVSDSMLAKISIVSNLRQLD
jgi:hypothetical protein